LTDTESEGIYVSFFFNGKFFFTQGGNLMKHFKT